MKKAYWFASVLFLLASGDVIAGWYRVSNYTGQIGSYPVHLSIQRYDFGPGKSVMGSYYYDKHLSPIPLYGQEDKGGNLSLCEVHNEKEYDAVVMHGFKNGFDSSICPLKFTPTSDGAVGQWSDARHTYAVALKNVGSFDDTKTSEISGTMEIPFWGQTQRHAFIGVYALSKTEDMVDVRVRVIDKKTGAVIQTIDPDCSFGFYMTPIYMNIERGSSGSEGVYFNCAGARDSELLYYVFSKRTGKYRLDRAAQ